MKQPFPREGEGHGIGWGGGLGGGGRRLGYSFSDSGRQGVRRGCESVLLDPLGGSVVVENEVWLMLEARQTEIICGSQSSHRMAERKRRRSGTVGCGPKA